MDDKDFYLNCLKMELVVRSERNSHYSLRAYAKACGFSPGVMSQFLSGKRIPSFQMAEKIIKALKLSHEEQECFLSSLAKKHQKRGLKRISPAFKKIIQSPTPKELSLDLFKVIGDWYHYAILMLTYVEQFNSDPKWIAEEIGITKTEAQLAINRLIQVGLIRKDKDGSLVATEEHFTTSDKNVTNSALKMHTKQSLQKAIASVDNDPIDMRSMTYMTMAIDPNKISEAKKIIEDFTNRMSGVLETGKRSLVYEFGVYLYPLQKINQNPLQENI
jgi:uncharacterized protein (TIGR02147 family)